jgi:pimeloyl-ACP methyl ester carboxylesterase
MLMRSFFPNDETFSYEALRAAGYSNYGGGDLGEIFNICARIRSGDEEAWLREWKAAAERAEQNASTSASRRNNQSAFTGYLRASNYYRTAEFFRRSNPFDDKEAHYLFDKSSETFLKAMELGPYECQQVQIPYEDTTLPAYVLLPQGERIKLKTIVFNGGYDSTKEESWFAIAAAALERGYAVVAFDGPGQGSALRQQRLFFRHDWEKVLTPVLDYVLCRPEVDAERVVVFAWSMGGYLVARGATCEYRAAALILDDGVYDFGLAFRKNLPGFVQTLLTHRYDGTINALVRQAMGWSSGLRWGLLNGLWTFGIDSPADFVRATSKYTLEGRGEMIKTPCLILDAAEDHFLRGQPKVLADNLKCDHTLITLDKVDGGETHCHQGAFGRVHQVVFDYLAERFRD